MPHTKDGCTVVTHSVDNYGVNYSFEWDSSLKAQRWTCYTLTSKTWPITVIHEKAFGAVMILGRTTPILTLAVNSSRKPMANSVIAFILGILK